MKAVGYVQHKPGLGVEGLVDLDIATPEPGPGDLLVRVMAVAVNPRDIKMRGAQRASELQPRILGWDAAGIVEAVGGEVTGFRPGDHVLYAGNMLRSGANAELHLVDARIAGLKPETLDFATAAALPLASLTAWEMLFERLRIPCASDHEQRLLILGGAGGVATMAIQLARQRSNATIIATASRPESAQWVREMGAHHVISHKQGLAEQLALIGQTPLHHAFSMRTTPAAFEALCDAAAPFGAIGFIDEPAALDVNRLKPKSLSLHAEAVFARPIFETRDIGKQREILEEVARLTAAGTLRSPVGAHLGKINATNLRKAHTAIESGTVVGKLVLEGF